MRILVFGGGGMAGHVIRQYLAQQTEYEVWSTIRGQSTEHHLVALDVTDEVSVISVLKMLRPVVVINAVGLLNQYAEQNRTKAIYVNGLFPHILAQYGKHLGYRLIHISTDCVFSGNRGNYTEQDIADGTTVYAKTKWLGEIDDQQNLTIRTSIIGPELKLGGIGLFHWFMQQTGEIRGYRQVFWNGVTTLELAKAIEWALNHPIAGLAHLAAPEKLSKYALLNHLKDVFAIDDVFIHPFDGIQSDKSLVNTRQDFSYQVSPYTEMLADLKVWMKLQRSGSYPYKYV
ncbi:SDR family oxidoreductase [Fodinisporobacter ferrooxydans]|uniref:dTDP-4-dehydrorhamnose reductase n=1 Tax=Fodinisporobacter ferrooxydans TaxID=2901836 RepID=A0ABY4CJP4_9BACL|nr:SDR family oxidoreductase [Alicyclobacillaceae bacterium MYW30-H2]